MIAPNEIMHSDVSMSEFKYEIMTSIFWDFQKELWYDPSAKQEVMTKLWLHDSEREYYEGWKNYPPVGNSLTLTDTNLESPHAQRIEYILKYKRPESTRK